MTYDLRKAPWIPFRRLSGSVEWGPPDLLVDSIDRDPVVALATPRPDFDGALTEFLIGLVTVAFRLESERGWPEFWQAPPDRDALRDALRALPAAFDLDGDGPRFLQDFSPADLANAELLPVQKILVNGNEKNHLFMKPDTLRHIGRPAAAMALITVQTYSPAGGQRPPGVASRRWADHDARRPEACVELLGH